MTEATSPSQMQGHATLQSSHDGLVVSRNVSIYSPCSVKALSSNEFYGSSLRAQAEKHAQGAVVVMDQRQRHDTTDPENLLD